MDQNKRILIIDQDIKTQKEYINLFSQDDYEVEFCTEITKAIEMIKNVKFDCIIMDVMLKKLKGYEAVPIIKAIDPKVKIIMTSNENSIELEKKVRAQDVFYYHIKSFQGEELKLAVNYLFQKSANTRRDQNMDRQKTILVVDDDRDYVEATRMFLDANDYHVEAAYNRSEALKKIRQISPDLILLDIIMEYPSDGFSLCYQIKHDPKLKDIPVLVVSGINKKTGLHFSPQTDGEYFQADAYLDKPIEPKKLLKRIEDFLQTKK